MFEGVGDLQSRRSPGPATLRAAGLAAALAVLWFASPADAQNSPAGTPSSSTAPAPTPGDLTFGPRALSAAPSQALEGALDADAYRLGPGDEIAVTIWGERSFAHDLRVTPEGKVLIPLVGEIVLDQLTLPEATERIRSAILERFRNVDISVTLVNLRTFQVHVVGEVVEPGTYEARAIDRVSSVITRSGGLKPQAGLRRIEVRQADTLRVCADLLRFARLGDLGANPLLRDGDVVHVPMVHERVWIYGDVQRPGIIELAPGDSLGGLIALAGGLSAGAVTDSIELSSYEADGTKSRQTTILAADTNGFGLDGAAVELRGDDKIFVRRKPEWHEENVVTVAGEVMFPGSYVIEPGETKLTNVVDRAGGFTVDASLEEAELIRTRGETADRDFERLSKLDPSEMRDDEYDYMRARSRLSTGRMTVDFVRLFRERDLHADVSLEPGDTIRVPEQRDYVKVLGRVVRPGNVLFRPGADADYYVQEAGGYTWNASKGKVRVIKTITGQWLRKGDADRLEPGDTVWVPEKPDRDYWKIARDAMTFLTGLATIYIVIDSARGN